jgi:hypothetical protein
MVRYSLKIIGGELGMEIGIELFLATHDQFLSLLDQAYLTGDTAGLLPLLGPDYHGYFGTRQEDRASFYDLNDALEGIQQTGKAYPGLRSGFKHRCVRMPSEKEAVVFYEKSMDLGARVGYAFVLEVWRYVDEQWHIVRETVETV